MSVRKYEVTASNHNMSFLHLLNTQIKQKRYQVFISDDVLILAVALCLIHRYESGVSLVI